MKKIFDFDFINDFLDALLNNIFFFFSFLFKQIDRTLLTSNREGSGARNTRLTVRSGVYTCIYIYRAEKWGMNVSEAAPGV